MIIGIPKEIKEYEYRVGVVQAGVAALCSKGHTVLIESGAGLGSNISDKEYKKAGAEILDRREEIFKTSDMIIKVKEPVDREFQLLKKGQILYTFLHLAAAPKLAEVLLKKGIIGIAYETVQLDDGSLPLLIPMSEIAGRMSIQEGARYLQKGGGGRGVLLSGVPGVSRGKVTIIGGGAAGTNAAKMAAGMGADVTIIDIDLDRLRYLDDIFRGSIKTLASNKYNILNSIIDADLVIGAVLIPGEKAPSLVSKDMVKKMKKGAVIVDICIDQGGCVETSRPTSHKEPVFIYHDVIHYCVTNMPGVFSTTSTFALTNTTLRYALEIANKGAILALKENPVLMRGLNTAYGKVTHQGVAGALKKKYHDPLGLFRK